MILTLDVGSPQINEIYYYDLEELTCGSYVDVPIIATTENISMGIIGKVRIWKQKGEGLIIFDERTKVDEKVVSAASAAALFAEEYTGIRKTDFILSFDLNTRAISGKSTGASMAVGMIALLLNKSIAEDTIITGPVDEKGNLLMTGGLPVKVISAGTLRFKKMIIPKEQSIAVVYDRKLSGPVSDTPYYLGRQVNLTKYASEIYNMQLSEAENIKEVIGLLVNS